MSFNDILGQESAAKKLRALITGGRIPPALLFHGPEGVGKFLMAKEFAKALDCTGPEPADAEDGLFGAAPSPAPEKPPPAGDACGRCVSCSQADKGVHPDMRIVDSQFQGFLLEEDSQKQKILRIDTIREITRYVYQKAILSKWKVFIVNDAHTLNTQSQNAMLKMLEEPPPDNLFILVAAKKNLLLSTIVSRSCSVEFTRLPAETVSKILVRQGMDAEEASALGALSDGSVKKACDIKKVRDRVADIGTGPRAIFKLAAGLPREPYMAREEAKLLLDMLLVSARKSWLGAPAGRDASARAALIRRLLEYRRVLNQNVSHGLVLEAALLECDKLGIAVK